MNRSSGLATYRLQVASRILLAAVGGYAFASACEVLLALLLPIPRPQAVLASAMLSFVWYTLAAIWIFSTRSTARAWGGIVLATSVVSLACWLLLLEGSP